MTKAEVEVVANRHKVGNVTCICDECKLAAALLEAMEELRSCEGALGLRRPPDEIVRTTAKLVQQFYGKEI